MFLIAAVCYLYLTHISCASSDTLKTTMHKRDIGLQTCIQNFDVHKDKIIRTQDSKEMGAKYINEIDLGSREECLRLCCEIDSCDVFVFEEKNSGSCYLFQCGPPEDFKCKFTHHANYSSAILAINRHLPDLEKQIKLTKHEQDLTKLRIPSGGKEQQTPKILEKTTTTSSIATNDIKAVLVSTTPMSSNSADTHGVKCSRYQFECRSTKECIAIYNACDGIPQCADGSDEGYELGCPEATTKTATQTNQKQGSLIDTNIPTMPKNGLTKGKQFPPSKLQNYFSPSSKQQDDFQASSVQRPESDFIRPNSQVPRPINYDNQLPRYSQVVKSQGSNWAQHPPVDIGQQYQQYEDGNHMYNNYKDNGLQISEGQEISRSRYEDIRDNHKPNYYNGAYQQIPQQYEEKWNGNNQDSGFRNGNPYLPDANQNPSSAWAPQTNNPDENIGLSQEPLDNWKQKIPSVHHEHEKMAHELKHSKELMENLHSSMPDNSAKIEKFETHKSNDHIQYSKVTQYKVDLDLEDGIAETPGGAVLSLTLGLIITCVMALLIGCRLRIVRRRIRRGGKSYAHDADYLVNGMYL